DVTGPRASKGLIDPCESELRVDLDGAIDGAANPRGTTDVLRLEQRVTEERLRLLRRRARLESGGWRALLHRLLCGACCQRNGGRDKSGGNEVDGAHRTSRA